LRIADSIADLTIGDWIGDCDCRLGIAMAFVGPIAALISGSLVLGAGFAQTRPDFGGTWVLDAERSSSGGGGRGDPTARGQRTGPGGGQGGGTGLGAAPERIRIRHDADVLTIDQDFGDRSLTVVYRFDGNPAANTLALGRGRSVPDATYTSTWRGSRLRTMIKAKLAGRVGTFNVEFEELRYLERDGRMVVETAARSGRGGGRRRAVYNPSR
jgi:hypothetical protein